MLQKGFVFLEIKDIPENYNKSLLGEVFVMFRIIKVEVGVISRS